VFFAEKQIDLKSVDLKKLKVRDLKKILNDVTRSDALALVGRMEKNFTSGILKAVFKYYTFVSDLFLGG